MHPVNATRPVAATILCALLVFFAGITTLQAQTKQFMTWQEDLYYLQTLDDADLTINRDGIEQIRKGVELYIEMQPATEITIPPAPARPWDAKEIRNQIGILQQAVDAILKEDPNRPFSLGTTEISVTSEASPLSPTAATMDGAEIKTLQALTVAKALDYLPGLSLDRSANRNETLVFLRGFTSLGRIPLYLDGIPIQVPYDGTLDLNRFLTNDIGEIQVAKGFSSPLLGANNLGGSINLVTRQPEKKFELDTVFGTGSGELFQGAIQIGTKWDKFYLQLSTDYLQREYIPLSGDFTVPSRNQTDYKLNNSGSQDAKYSGRIAYTPKGRNEYTFSYTNQKGEKSQPLYTGDNNRPPRKNWDWPYWNKYSYYFISNTEVGESGSFKLRMFYDQFKNGLASFFNPAYDYKDIGNIMFYSEYDDHTGGLSSEFTTRMFPRNTASLSFTFKDDTHKSTDRIPETQPTILDRAQTLTFGFQDVVTVTSKLRATVGFSADHLKGLHGQDTFDSDDDGVDDMLIPLACRSNPDNDSFRGCLPDEWTFNPQVSMSYTISGQDTVFATFADRGRFPLLKELYSYGLGARLPNPDLGPERSRNWNIGYTHVFGSRTVAQLEYFHNTIRDAINDVLVPDPGAFCPEYDGECEQWTNIAREKHQGFEVSIKSTPIRRMTLDTGYSYINRVIEYGKDPEGLGIDLDFMILRTLPKHKVVINGFFDLPYSILALATLKFEGGINVQDQSYRSAPPMPFSVNNAVLDLGFTSPVFEGFKWQAGVKNLFDRNYFYTPGYPEAGRNWYFNTRYEF
ncbi:MAG: TonB-dependent receptor [Acidobacteria bacterium]|nr:TonB-dependent receptor [Acidobacteriota bacterium]